MYTTHKQLPLCYFVLPSFAPPYSRHFSLLIVQFLPVPPTPLVAVRPKGKEKFGFAAQSFNMPEIAGVMSGWISGITQLSWSLCLQTRRNHTHSSYYCVFIYSSHFTVHLQPFTLTVNFYRVYLTVSFLPCVSPSPGFVVLPAGAIKDAEGVGDCSQVFFVSECQDGAGGSRVRSRVPPAATTGVIPRYTHKYPISHTHSHKLSKYALYYYYFSKSSSHPFISISLSSLPPSLPPSLYTPHTLKWN